MNIHFDNIDLFKKLTNSTIVKVKVGSHLYGTNNANSDVDYLSIYATSKEELNSFISTNNQLQYKKDNIDYNFVSLHTFLRNIINGDSTINFEVVQSDSLISTDLEWLLEFRESFKTYTMIRSYLGMARRDINHFGKYKLESDKRKRFGHIVRGCLYASNLINKTFDFNLVNKELVDILSDLDYNSGVVKKSYVQKISELRDDLTDRFNSKTLGLSKNINVEEGILITNKLFKYCNSDLFKDKQLIDFDMYLYINSFENWVEY